MKIKQLNFGQVILLNNKILLSFPFVFNMTVDFKNNHFPINWWMDKQNVVYPYNGILYDQIRGWSNDTGTTQMKLEQYAQWKKSDTKGCILHNFLCMRCPE